MLNKPVTHESSANVAGIFVGTSCYHNMEKDLEWLVDSGAKNHMVNHDHFLHHGLTVTKPESTTSYRCFSRYHTKCKFSRR